MKLESVGIIISLRPFGERDVVAHIFTADFGVLAGMIKGGAVGSRTNSRPMVGQLGTVSWNARLESQLGVFHFESMRNLAALFLSDMERLSFMNSAFDLLQTLLPEREFYGPLYTGTKKFLLDLADVDDAKTVYINWEILLLSGLGYALDLSRCSNCGVLDNLTHISPKTARAVCQDCAKPYLDRLLPLPVDLKTTEFFLLKIVGDMGLPGLPLARRMLSQV